MELLDLVVFLLSLIGGSSVTAAVIPSKVRSYIPLITKVIDFLGANIGNAKNAEPAK